MDGIGLIGFPMDLGAGKRGVDMGPSAIRLTDLDAQLAALGITARDLGNVLVHTRALIGNEDPTAHYIDEIMRACHAGSAMVVDALVDGLVPVMLGGDHSVAMASLSGMAKHYGGPGGVIWVDAHGDLNTPQSSPSGNLHGMALAAALGLCNDDPRFGGDEWPAQSVLPEHTVLIGTRDLDEGEREYLSGPNTPTVFTMSDIDRHGIASVAEQAIAIAGGARFCHVTLDLDVVDPRDAPGVGTPVRGGLSYREAHMLLELLSQAPVTGIDVVEVNPVLDVENATAILAAELLCSLLGKRIL